MNSLKKFSIFKLHYYLLHVIKAIWFSTQRFFISIRILFILDKLKELNGKIVVYSAITGSKDQVKRFKKCKGVSYIFYTDNPDLQSKTWEIRPITILDPKYPRLNAKRPKILPHKLFDDFEYSIWIDGSITPKVDLRYLVFKYLKNHSIAFLKHPWCDCIYEESINCITLKKGDPRAIKKQMAHYQQNGYPEHNGLIAGTIIFRKHGDKLVIKVMDEWWNEINAHSIRDQLSFNYVAHTNNLSYNVINKNLYSNCYFTMTKHSK